MKPYIMNYSTEHKLIPPNFTYCPSKQLNILRNGSNVISKSIGSTITGSTEALESIDPDELAMTSTLFTKTLEPTDPDEILMGSTGITETIEPIDPDEIII